MREIIKLEDGNVKVTVNEFKVKHVKRIMQMVSEVTNSAEVDPLAPDDAPVTDEFDIGKLLGNYDTIIDILDTIIIVKGEGDHSDVKSVEDLSFSQVDEIMPVVQKVNKSFFAKMGLQNLNLSEMWDQTAL